MAAVAARLTCVPLMLVATLGQLGVERKAPYDLSSSHRDEINGRHEAPHVDGSTRVRDTIGCILC